ncbi:MAG TPA: SPW repeat protein [Ktedonobacteraceae bacterium]|nr:SPW repeat protein [Ktedonobacteraceae bacterium]
MKAWTRWQNWVALVLGVILFITPWVFGTYTHPASSWDAWVLGVIGVILALWALASPASSMVSNWITVVLGIVLFISPWVLGFATVTAAAWSAWVIGVLFVIAAGWVILESRTPSMKATA